MSEQLLQPRRALNQYAGRYSTEEFNGNKSSSRQSFSQRKLSRNSSALENVLLLLFDSNVSGKANLGMCRKGHCRHAVFRLLL